MPTAQTSFEETAETPSNQRLSPGRGVGTLVHSSPSQCKARGPLPIPTAQISSGAITARSRISVCQSGSVGASTWLHPHDGVGGGVGVRVGPPGVTVGLGVGLAGQVRPDTVRLYSGQ